MTVQAARPRFRLSPTIRRILITIHIIVSVGLLGDSAGFLAVAIEASQSTDLAFIQASGKTLETFSLVFGIPLSFTALLTGVVLGLTSRWGLFRYWWVTVKLSLIVTVILVGALLLRSGIDSMMAGSNEHQAGLIIGAAWDVVALTAATILGVYKPGGRWKEL